MEMSVLVRSRESHSSREGFGCSTFADEGDGTEGSEEVGVFDAVDEIDVCTRKMARYQSRSREVIDTNRPRTPKKTCWTRESAQVGNERARRESLTCAQSDCWTVQSSDEDL